MISPSSSVFLAKRRTKGSGPAFSSATFRNRAADPMITGHASHQIGLDADIWLTPKPEHSAELRRTARKCRRSTW